MSEIILPVKPHGFDATNPAGLVYENQLPVLLFDDSTAEYVYWRFKMPDDYSSSPVLKLIYSMASAASGTIEMDAQVWATSDGEATGTESYDTANTATETVPGTAGLTSALSITLTNNDSLAAGDLVAIKLYRDATDATNDTATGDLELRAISLTYTAA